VTGCTACAGHDMAAAIDGKGNDFFKELNLG
jgi:hypothetical protein